MEYLNRRRSLILLVTFIFLDFASSATTISPQNNTHVRYWRPWTLKEYHQGPSQSEKVLQVPVQKTSISQTTEYSILQSNPSPTVLAPWSSQEHNLQNQPGPYRHKKFGYAHPQASSKTQTTYSTPQTSTLNNQEIGEPINEIQEALHLRVGAKDEQRKCAQCQKIFSSESNRKQHEMSVHSGKKSHQCIYCQEDFSTKSQMKRHERLHTGEKSYACKYCGKRFSRSDNRDCHLRVHTGEKSYACKYCGKRFSRSDSRDCHLRVHTGEKPFKCKYCGKGFRTSGNKSRHERTHLLNVG